MYRTTHQQQPTNEEGFASLAIALVLILVLSLLSVSFAQLSRHEQQNTLGAQLASQAYFAAESGINDAYADIKGGIIREDNPDALARRTGCMKVTDTNAHTFNVAKPGYPSKAILDKASGLSYSCLLTDLTPNALAWTKVQPFESHSMVFAGDNPTLALDRFNVGWSSTKGNTKSRSVIGELPSSSSWTTLKAPPVIVVSVVPILADRDAMIANALHFVAYPTLDGTTGAVRSMSYSSDPSNQGKFIGTCSTAGHCVATITGLSTKSFGSAPKQHYLIHYTNYYDTAEIAIQDAYSASNIRMGYGDGQTQIDVTGKAKDISKRFVVRLPLTNLADTYPGNALDVQNVCKRLATQPLKTDSIGISNNIVTDPTLPCNEFSDGAVTTGVDSPAGGGTPDGTPGGTTD